MAHSLSYNSIDLGGSSYGMKVTDMPAVMWAEPNLVTVDALPSRNGGYAQATHWKSKTIDVQVTISGSSTSDLKNKLDAVRGALDPTAGAQSLQFDDFYTDRSWTVRLQNVSNEAHEGYTVTATLTFIAPDPLGYGTETQQVLTVATDPQTFSMPTSGTIAGNTKTPATWVVYNSGSSSVDLAITNNTTDQTISIDNLGAGHYIRVNGATKYVEHSMDGITYSAGMTFVGTNRQFPQLDGGTANSITVTGLSSGSVTAIYQGAYL